jgi:hypothetical protein
MSRILLPILLLPLLTLSLHAADAPDKPKVAFFPLAGNAKEELRDRVGFSLRAKLDRAGTYEVIDGPKMQEIAAEAKDPITFDTPPDAIKLLGKLVDAAVLAWGDLSNTADGATLRLNLLDLRDQDPKPRQIKKIIKDPTDVRFASEEILQSLKGVGPFEHFTEVAVHNDPQAEELWKKNPNLVKNPDFSTAGAWEALYMKEKYPPPISDRPPAPDQVVIHRLNEAGKTNPVLAMNLSKTCAENNGMACLSDPIKIDPDTRYRLSFRYKSDAPTLHVFVKGYTPADNINGQKVEREIYRRQVPVTGKTDGQWVTITDELNPQHIVFPVQTLRIDLYAYLQPGLVMFDDVQLKAVGKQTRQAKDKALDKPLSRPKGTK